MEVIFQKISKVFFKKIISNSLFRILVSFFDLPLKDPYEFLDLDQEQNSFSLRIGLGPLFCYHFVNIFSISFPVKR